MVDLLAEDLVADPYPDLHALRSRDPVHWSERHRAWIITRYRDVAAGFREGRLSNEHTGLGDPRDALVRVLRHWMEFRDPPAHTRLRRLVQRAFTPRVIEALRPRIADLVNQLLAPLCERGGGDYMQAFAYPLPAIVIAEMLGVPAEDRERFRGWSEEVKSFVFGGLEDPDRMSRARHGFEELDAYFRNLVDRYRRAPADNLLSALAATDDSDESLTIEEIVGTSVLLLFGGHETTSNLLANGLVALERFPEQRARLEAHPEEIPAAIEEFLRWEGPTALMVRVCREDFEFAGRRFRAGERVFLHQGAANRDPEQFEEPDRVDVRRANATSHLAFGFGTHYCLGAPLARLEGSLAFDGLIGRYSQLRVQAGRLEWNRTMMARNLRALPVASRDTKRVARVG